MFTGQIIGYVGADARTCEQEWKRFQLQCFNQV